MKILLVEDDELIATPLAKALTDQHYTVDVAAEGRSGWELVESYTYDLILLDVVLPYLDGISFCRKLRSQGNQTPILLLTAQDTSTSKVMGLDAGADDYVAKPFDLQELLARIRALLRRGGAALPPLLQWQNLKLDPSACEVTCDRQTLHLTPKEYGLLELLLRNSNRIFSCGALIDQLWSFEEPPTEDTVRSHVKGLRQKLKAAGVSKDPIETVYGIGYRLRAADQGKEGKKQKRKNEGTETLESPLPFPIPTPQSLGNTSPSPTSIPSKIQNPQLKPPPSHPSNAQTVPGVTRIWEQVQERFNQRVAVLEQATTMLLQNQLSDDLRQRAEQEAHKLAGSLGMFGSDEGSRLAQAIEPLFEPGAALNQAQTQQLAQMVIELRRELQQMDTRQVQELLTTNAPPDTRPWLLIVDQDQTLSNGLALEAANWGMRSQIIPDPVTAREYITDERPDAVLIDLTASEGEQDKAASLQNALMLLAELSACTPPVPVIVFSLQDNLIDRVKIARLGGRGWLQKPVSPIHAIEMVHQALQHVRTAEVRVMVVDDDPQVLIAVQTLLVPWGMKVSILDNPLLFLDMLESVAPDLLILDVEMPHVNGIELCRVVRNDPRWSKLPILFLTAHTNSETMHQVFMAGADDFVSKPIVGPELITRILNRLERSRLLRNLTETDALTGVANYRKSTQELNQLIQWGDRYHQPLCMAIVDLDYLKSINNRYGHDVGDQVLLRLGELLRRTFHGAEVVGRWGGAEFVIGMPGMSRADGVQRLADVLRQFNQLEFASATRPSLQASFSAAVVQYPQDGPTLQVLYETATHVLAQAKTAGGNCVLNLSRP